MRPLFENARGRLRRSLRRDVDDGLPADWQERFPLPASLHDEKFHRWVRGLGTPARQEILRVVTRSQWESVRDLPLPELDKDQLEMYETLLSGESWAGLDEKPPVEDPVEPEAQVPRAFKKAFGGESVDAGPAPSRRARIAAAILGAAAVVGAALTVAASGVVGSLGWPSMVSQPERAPVGVMATASPGASPVSQAEAPTGAPRDPDAGLTPAACAAPICDDGSLATEHGGPAASPVPTPPEAQDATPAPRSASTIALNMPWPVTVVSAPDAGGSRVTPPQLAIPVRGVDGAGGAVPLDVEVHASFPAPPIVRPASPTGARIYRAPEATESALIGKLDEEDFVEVQGASSANGWHWLRVRVVSSEGLYNDLAAEPPAEAYVARSDMTPINQPLNDLWASGARLRAMDTINVRAEPTRAAPILGALSEAGEYRVAGPRPQFSEGLYWIALDNGSGRAVFAATAWLRPAALR